VTSNNNAVGKWSILHFSQANAAGRGQGDVPALLRRVAKSISTLGPVTIQDIAFHNEMDDDGNDCPYITVYYYRPRARKP